MQGFLAKIKKFFQPKEISEKDLDDLVFGTSKQATLLQQLKEGKATQKPSKFTGHCHHCTVKLLGMNSFKCVYCGNYFCSSCRLPETHNCPSDQKTRFTHPQHCVVRYSKIKDSD